MAKSRARFLSELLGSTGLVKKSKSALAGADEVLDLDVIPSIPNTKLTNSSISIADHATALGGSVTLTTSDIGEHTDYKYYTDARADARIVNAGSGNWNTAYGWGDHSAEGYLKSYTDTNTTYSAGTGITLTGTTFSLTDTNSKLNLSGGTMTGKISMFQTNDIFGLSGTIANYPRLSFYSSEGTHAAKTQTQEGDLIGQIDFNPHTASSYTGGGKISFIATEAITSSKRGTEARIYSTKTDQASMSYHQFKDEELYVKKTGGTTYKYWHAGNDGSDSGLDADKLDAQQGSYYLDYANFTNTPTIPSLSGYATESYVDTAVSDLVDSSPAALNTLNELAAALGDDANFSTTVTTSIATKLPKAGGTLTGELNIHKTNAAGILNLRNTSDSGVNPVTITFSSQGTSGTQIGHIKYTHSNALSYGANESFTIGGTESPTVILADGRFYYKDGIYKKPATGTGAGTRKDANWDTAYGWGNHAGLYLGATAKAADSNLFDGVDSVLYQRYRGDIGNEIDLDTFTTMGIYNQNSNAQATAGSNYPLNAAGMLTVTADGVMIYQTYQGYASHGTYERKYYNGTWEDWHLIYDSGVPVYTFSSNNQFPLKITGTHNQKILLSGASSPLIEFHEGTNDRMTFGYSSLNFGQWKVWDDDTNAQAIATLRLRSDGTLKISGNNGTTEYRVFTQGYRPYADKWTTARSHTVTLTGEVTGTASQTVDGTGNKTWSIATTLNNTALDDQYVDVTGDTMTGDLLISKSDAKIKLYDSTGTSGNNPFVEWETTASQGIRMELNVYDSELPVNGYGLVVRGGPSNGQFPTTGTLTFDVLGEIYAGGTTLSTLNKVFHDAYHPNADKWTTARSHTVTLTGEVTGTASQTVDGTGNKTWSIATTLGNTALDDQYVDVTGDTMTGALKIDVDDQADGALRIVANQTNPEQDFYFAEEIISTLSGSTTTTADREQGGIFLDINSTATGGGTSHEHRVYGIYADVDSTGDADSVTGGYFNATATPTTGTTTGVSGVVGFAEDNGGAGGTTTIAGVKGTAWSDNATSDANTLVGGTFKTGNSTDSGAIGVSRGVIAEIEFNGTGLDLSGSSYVFEAQYDNNTGVAQTHTAVLYYGNYTGTLPTTAYGLYIVDDVRNYIGGSITGKLGSTSNPTYSFNGDLNTGMYSPANHQLGFTINGTERLRLSSSGLTSVSNIGAADDVRTGLTHDDSSAMAAGVGGQLVLGYKYDTGGTYTEGAIIKMYKENGTSGHYGSGLRFQVRNTGVGLSTKMTLDPSGNLDITGGLNSTAGNYSTTTSRNRFNTASGYIELGPMNTTYAHIYTDRGSFYFNKNTLYANGNKMWTAGNDGSGSGLDADLLDGSHKVDIQRQLINVTSPGVTAADSCLPSTGYGFKHFLGLGPSNNDGHILGMTWSGTTTYGAQIYVDTDPNNIMAFRSRSSTGVWTSWNTVWHTGNDGSGSGLDADLLDGQHASAFLGATAKATDSNLLDGLDSTDYKQYKWRSIVVGGDLDKFYPVLFSVGNGNHASSDLEIAQSSVHQNGSGHGAFYARFGLNTTGWGHVPQMMTLREYSKTGNTYISKIADTDHATGQIGIWLRGSTTYYYRCSDGAIFDSVRCTDNQSFLSYDSTNNVHDVTISHSTSVEDAIFNSSAHIGKVLNTGNIGAYAYTSSNDGSGSGLDADFLDGYNAEETAVNNSIVKRDGTATIKVNGITISTSISNDFTNNGSVQSTDAIDLWKGKRGTAAGMRTPSIGVEGSGTGIYLKKKFALEEAVGLNGTGEITITGGVESGQTESSHHRHATTWSYGQIHNFISGTGGYLKTYYTGSSATTDAVGLTMVDVSGNFIAKGNVTAYGTVSDIRLKENIEVIPNALEKVQKLRGVTFNYKEDNNRSTGLIAQELQKVLPEVVYETENIDTKEKHYAVRYGNITGLLVEAMKEQSDQINAQQKQINELTSLVKDLTRRK